MSGLCVCMIARNEAERIGAALSSVADISNQIIVVDTGSTDDTAAIARRFGALIVEHRWADHFAAARNAAVSHIRQPWSLWLDADERLLPENRELLSPMLLRSDALAYRMTRRELVDCQQGTGQPLPYVLSRVTRLVRTDAELRYTGRCHEQFEPSLAELSLRLGLNVYNSPLILDHECDYFFEGRARKARRNSPLLELEVRERPGRLYFMIQCAASLLELPESSARGHLMMTDVLKRVADMRDQSQVTDSILFLALEYAARYVPPAGTSLPLAADDAIELAARWFPRAAPVIWLQAQREYGMGHFSVAASMLQKLIELGRTHRYDPELPFDPTIVGDDAHLNLGVCLLRLGELDAAAAEFDQIAATSPRIAQVALNRSTLSRLRAMQGGPSTAT